VRAIGNQDSGISTGREGIVSGNIVRGGLFGISVGFGSIVTGNTASGTDVAISAGSNSIVSSNVTSSGENTLSAGSGSIVSNNIVASGDFGLSVGSLSTVSGNNVGAIDLGIFAGPGSTVSGNTAHPQSEGDDPAGPAIEVRCPSNVIGNTATGAFENLILNGDGCTNIDNLAPRPPEACPLRACPGDSFRCCRVVLQPAPRIRAHRTKPTAFLGSCPSLVGLVSGYRPAVPELPETPAGTRRPCPFHRAPSPRPAGAREPGTSTLSTSMPTCASW
jgi:hypothetical protein